MSKPELSHTTSLFALFVGVFFAIVLIGAIASGRHRGALEPIALNHRIDVNTADAATLQLLPGVGPGLAANLVTHRQRLGRFDAAEQFEQVRLIGPIIRARMEPFVRFSAASADGAGSR